MFLKNFKPGTPLLLLDTWYERPTKVNGKREDRLHLMYKHIETGEKYLETLVNPEIDIYFTKDDIEYSTVQPHIAIDKVVKHTTKYKDVLSYIAEYADKRTQTTKYTDFFYDCIKKRNFDKMKQLHQYRHVHSSDIDIEDYYRIKFLEYYRTEDLPITKAFMDIETDIIDSKSNLVEDLIEYADSPVNAVTLIFENEKKIYSFFLRNEKNKLIEEFEASDMDAFKEEIKSEYKDILVDDYELKIVFFDEEIDLIRSTFKAINMIKPDFMLVWNLGFDIQYLINRLNRLGYDPTPIICHKDFHHIAQCRYYQDRNPKHNKWEDKDSWFTCTSYTVYLDQMINYAKVNKGGSQIPNYKLDYIAERDLGINKLDSGDFATFPYRDFRLFAKYNIVDTLLLLGIERKSEHVNTIILRGYDSGTRLSKVFKQSIFLTNYAHISYPEMGYILGSNHNIQYVRGEEDESEDKFIGAIVGKPINNSREGEFINGERSMFVFINTADYDYGAMYPNGRDSHNIDETSQYGMLLIDQKISEMENIYENEKYNRGGNFLDDFQTQAMLSIGSKWFGLPSIDDVLDYVCDMSEIEVEEERVIDPKKIFIVEFTREGIPTGAELLSEMLEVRF